VSLVVVAALIALGAAVGLMSAMFGVGGGVIMVPFIVVVLGETQHLAEGTSLAVIVPTAIVGVIAHHKRGYVSFSSAAVLAATGVFGAFIGARLALSLDPATLKTYFGGFVLVVGVRLLLEGRRLTLRDPFDPS
jgi:uncharacterized membrane protein YfcA